MTDDPTRIRIRIVPPTYSKLMQGILHFFHAEDLGKVTFRASHLKVELDDETRVIDATLEHVVPCSPGEHRLSVALLPPLTNPVAEHYAKVSAEVTVPAGKEVVVLYKIKAHGGPFQHAADLEVEAAG